MATYSSNTSNGYKLILEVSQSSQSIAGNSSVLKWTLKMSCATQYYQNSSTTDAFKVSINGTAVYNTSKAISFSGKNTTVTISQKKLVTVFPDKTFIKQITEIRRPL